MNLHQEREIADRVRQFLDSPEWKEAFETYRLHIFSLVEQQDDAETVAKLLAHLRTARAVKAHLELLVKNGAIARSQIEFEEKREEVKKKFPWLPRW